jgi:hypothetical protein
MERLGGYDAIGAVSEDLLPCLMSDSRLKRFWDHRGEDGIKREKPETERNEMVAFVQPLKADIVEV